MEFKDGVCTLWVAVRQNTGNEFILPDEISSLREEVVRIVSLRDSTIYQVSPVKRIIRIECKEIK